jgi:hypothetical protein
VMEVTSNMKLSQPCRMALEFAARQPGGMRSVA